MVAQPLNFHLHFCFPSHIHDSWASARTHSDAKKRPPSALEKTKWFTQYFIFVLNMIFSLKFLMSHCFPFIQTNTVTIYLTLFTTALHIICAPYPSGKHHASVVRMKTSLFQTLTLTYHGLFLTTVTQ